MSEEEKVEVPEEPKVKMNTWVKADGKTEIVLNDLEETEKFAKEQGWKKKK